MSATVFVNGDIATVENTFSVSGAATDPTTISLTITIPAGTTTTYTYAAGEITKVSTGYYRKLITSTTDGDYIAVWTGTGAAADVQTSRWHVFDADEPLYCSVEDLKSRFGDTQTSDDLEYRYAVEAASRWIDNYCDRYFYRRTTTNYYTPVCWYSLDIDDLVSLTTLATDQGADGVWETTWASSDYQLRPLNPAAGGETKPYTQLAAVGSYTFPSPVAHDRTDLVAVTGVFGWPAVPAAIREACRLLAAEHFKLKDAPFGVAGFNEFGPLRVGTQTMQRAQSMLSSYRKYAVLVG